MKRALIVVAFFLIVFPFVLPELNTVQGVYPTPGTGCDPQGSFGCVGNNSYTNSVSRESKPRYLNRSQTLLNPVVRLPAFSTQTEP